MRVRALLTVVLAVGLTACDGAGFPEGVVFGLRTQDVVAGIVVEPGRATLTSLGQSVRFVATPVDLAGQPVPGVAVRWTSSDIRVATIGAQGLARALGEGQVRITAYVGDVRGTATLFVDFPLGEAGS